MSASPPSRRRAIVTGMIATYPLGGVVWDYGQYALGLEQLGFEVFYLEDTGWETYDPRTGFYSDDHSYAVEFLDRSLKSLSASLGARWCFRGMDNQLYGPSADDWTHILASADLLLNVSGSAILRDEYMRCPAKVLIDTDPGLNQFQKYPAQDAHAAMAVGDRTRAYDLLIKAGLRREAESLDTWGGAGTAWSGANSYRSHDHFLTYAECIGRQECLIPDLGIAWQPTRPLAVMDRWSAAPPGEVWTTVMSWKNFPEPILADGARYGAKEMEFGRIQALPSHCDVPLEIAVSGPKPPIDDWRAAGWRTRAGEATSATAEIYRDYIESSRGEFSVAKNVYVATRSGWFSCRSACYLAAGRPVVVQDTGFSEILPTGEGVLAYSTLEEAVAGIEAVERDYKFHAKAARAFAYEYLDAGRVLGDMLGTVGLN